NLVVHGLIIENGYDGFSMFELGKVGIFIAVIGTIYVSVAGNKLLPGKKILLNSKSSAALKDYYYDVTIPDNSNLIGLEIKNGRAKELPKLFVRCIEREGHIIQAKKGNYTILQGDKLLLAGKSDRLNYILAN